MSIPPLVCSTPPPPDQCDDDKDNEDFDLHYNLSQDDEYDYGSFSTYSHFQSAISESQSLESPVINKINNNVNNSDSTSKDIDTSDSEILQWTKDSTELKLDHNDLVPEVEIKFDTHEEHVLQNTKYSPVFESSPSGEIHGQNELDIEEEVQVDKKIYEDEPNVEDLNLTVEEEESSSSTGSNIKNELYEETHSDKFDATEKTLHIPDLIDSIKEMSFNELIAPSSNITSSTSKVNVEEPPECEEKGQVDHEEASYYSNVKIEDDLETTFGITHLVSKELPKTLDSKEDVNKINNETDDEFEAIHDLNVSSNNKESPIDICVNPWENNQPDSDFGAFEAHFDETERTETSLFQASEEKSTPVKQDAKVNIEDDDFGDFDEFKSSAQETTVKKEILDPLTQVPLFYFQISDSESQVLENINNILNTIFVEDIPVPEGEFEGKLESLLCETWGHLLETDVRQPYIVNWNSSCGQKTLLKALCIDARNILFGPKWNSNMPKYAANLGVAPLQPQTQSTPPGSYQQDTNPDKSSTKVPTTWSDPFTSDGQESCNKENNAAVQKRPTDLNTLDFDPTLSTKPDKIYSSTLGIQPLRQISLPDTHIFTPTDSETPRSKTIHYDEPSVFLSPSSVDNDAKSTVIQSSISNTQPKNEDDGGDYSEFQDFKGSFNNSITQSVSASGLSLNITSVAEHTKLSVSNPTYSVGILQPIKLEPTLPTLNWPSPGEVKETFHDFSGIASNTNFNAETQTPNIGTENIYSLQIGNSITIKNNDIPASKNNNSFDDDFDTFQSALPANNPAPIIPAFNNFSNMQETLLDQNMSARSSSNMEPNLDFSFSDIHTVKSDAISLTRPNDILKYSEPGIENFPKAKESIVKIPAPPLCGAPGAPASVLQPVSASQTQQNSTQILQPLSLESFSQINWPNPGINLQDLSRFNPVETLNSLKSDLSVSGNSKGASPVHNQKSSTHSPEDDIWGEFVSSKPKPHQPLPKNVSSFADDDEWTDFVSSPTVKPQNGLNTISLNVHTNLSMQNTTKPSKLTVQNNQALEIPSLNYITPKSGSHSSYNDRHFQNL